jgi:RNA polymerase sigma-70 factor, ECF subfamily
MLPAAANGQPAAAAYYRGGEGAYQAYGIVVLTVTSTAIARITVFADPGLLTRFGFPPCCPGGTGAVPEPLLPRGKSLAGGARGCCGG